MFARFFKRDTSTTQNGQASATNNIVSSPNAADKDDSSDDGNKSDNSNDGQETLDLTVDIGGNRGWPTNVTVLMYHRVQGLICVGTEGGAVYVYGDGFQFVRTWLIDDPNEVVSIVPLYPNKILVAFADNSIVALELPTLEVLDLLPSTWLSAKDGDLTSMYCDLPSEKNFVYCGTSEGNLYVLDVMESAIRICDYSLTATDLGIAGQKMAITDIQINPRNDRFLALGCDGPNVESGMVVVFDLEKNKLHKNFKTAAISNINWHHMGEVLYAATRTGVLHSITVEKGTVVNSWNATSELIDGFDEEDDEDEGANIVSIRKLSWLAPQSNAMSDTGCLFALLSTRSADNDNLQNVIVGFSPVHGELTTILSLPPIPNEKIISFRIVPTYDRSAKELGPDDDVNITAAILLLTQRPNQDDKSQYDRHVKIIRCPTTPLSDWALEIGALPDPRKATEVQPAAADVTCIRGLLPKYRNPLSLAKALLMGVMGDEDNVVSTASLQKAPALQDVIESNEGGDSEDGSGKDFAKLNRRASQGRRLSARDFFEKNVGFGDLETQLNELDPWEMVLVAGEHEEKSVDKDLRLQDIIFNGHADGTVVAFGVSLPDNRKETGRGNVWLPLKALRCGTTSITAVTADETCGLLCVGDEAGYLVLYEVHDEDRQIGSTDIIRWVYDKFSQQAEDMITESGDSLTENVKSIDDFTEQQYYQELYSSYHHDYKFSALKQVFRIRLHDHVTCIHMLGCQSTVVVGTSDGSLYYCNNHANFKSGSNFKKVENVMTTGACGAVKSIEYGYYHVKSTNSVIADQLTFAYYVFYESGHILVVDAVTFSIRSYSIVLSKVAAGSSSVNLYDVSTMPLLGSTNKIVKKPTLLSFLYALARTKKLQEAASAAAALEPTEPDTPPPAPEPVKRSFFSRSAAPPAASPKPAVASTESNTPGLKHKIIEFSEMDVPVKLCFAKGLEVVTMSIDKFFAPSKKIDTFRNLAAGVSGVSVKAISKKSIVASVIFTFTDEGVTSDGFDSFELQDGENYLACLDEEGCLRLVSLKTKAVVSHADLLEGVAEGENTTLYSGTLLPNGNCYMLQKGTMLYSASVSSTEQKLVFPLPERAFPQSRGIDRSHVLLHGREQFLAGLKMTIKKRRSSVINLTAAPTDLYKIFAKTREQRAKEELFAGASEESNDNAATRANSKATKAMTDIQQLQQNFAERGDRINRIALKMDDFKQSAQEYKQTAQAQKELLRQRNARWGLF